MTFQIVITDGTSCYRNGDILCLCRVLRLFCHYYDGKAQTKLCCSDKICWHPKCEAGSHNYREECARWYCPVQTSSNGKRSKFRLILRLRNRCYPDWASNTATDTQLCAEMSTQLKFSHDYYNVNQADAPTSVPHLSFQKRYKFFRD
jgi:hypothetical protein